MHRYFSILLPCLLSGFFCIAQNPAPNYDESKAENYILPDPLILPSGKMVKNTNTWEKKQRPYLLKLLQENMYGRIPGAPPEMYFELKEMNEDALEGTAIRKQVTVHFSKKDDNAAMNLILYLPKSASPVPVFIGLNFMGNQTIDADVKILSSLYGGPKNGELQKTEPGSQSKRWPLREIIGAGFGVATAFYEDIEPDHVDGWKTGVRSLLQEDLNIRPDEWGAIAAWAWGLSRIQDYLETDPLVAANKTIITGHSRLGKAALWAAANDQRFAMVISNNSGEGGAALSKRIFGETTEVINTAFPHWFIEKYKTYNGHPENLPFDQHMLIALMAPRPVYIASASEDLWADPKGEFLSGHHAERVYNLYGIEGLGRAEWPKAEIPVGDRVRYHLRKGNHDMLLYDWEQYLRFAKEKLLSK